MLYKSLKSGTSRLSWLSAYMQFFPCLTDHATETLYCLNTELCQVAHWLFNPSKDQSETPTAVFSMVLRHHRFFLVEHKAGPMSDSVGGKFCSWASENRSLVAQWTRKVASEDL